MRKRTKPSGSSRAAATDAPLMVATPACAATQVAVLVRLSTGAVHEVVLTPPMRREVMAVLGRMFGGGPVSVAFLPCDGVTLSGSLDVPPTPKKSRKGAG